MSFRLRIVFVATILITILFSLGGAVLIHSTFQAALEKEEMAAVESNELVLKIVQYIGEDGSFLGEEDLISVVKRICTQDSIDCLRLTNDGEAIYIYRKEKMQDISMRQVTFIDKNQVHVTYFTTEEGKQCLQTTM